MISSNRGGPALQVYGYGGITPTPAIIASADNHYAIMAEAMGSGGHCFHAEGPGEVRFRNSDNISGVDGILYFGAGTNHNINRNGNNLNIGAIGGDLNIYSDNIYMNSSLIHSSDQRWKKNISSISSGLEKSCR